jgi:pimeloyl-ACP methyl ester carboxylesterase
MNRMAKKWTPILIILCFVTAITFTPLLSAATTPPLPTLVDQNPSGAEGDWLVGATPVLDAKKPVLVFIQGKGGNAASWWGDSKYSGVNDMYACAYNAGYRTAFVNFRDADGLEGTMWVNGEVLRNQLQQICAYFGVSKVNLICHSKGGIDAQTAIVHSGAYPWVAKVVTLSTPHWGSELADLAYSSWAGWLGELLGQRTDGTYVLQTGYMSEYRSVTDNRSENNSVQYYTIAGTDWGPFPSVLYTGGLYLRIYGENDGLVTVTSAHNPRATHVKTCSLNHDSIRIGNKVWSIIEPYVRSLTSTPSLSIACPAAEDSMSVDNVLHSAPTLSGENYLLKGGETTADQVLAVPIPVDSSVSKVTFDLLLADPQAEIKFCSPGGVELRPEIQGIDDAFFRGATHYLATMSYPESGVWKMTIQSPQKNAYMLITYYQSDLEAKLSIRRTGVKSDSPLHLYFDWNEQFAQKIHSYKFSADLNRVMKHGHSRRISGIRFTKKSNGLTQSVPAPQEPGLYNITASLEGELKDGTSFARSQVRSFIVESADENGVELLYRLGQEH